jgi:hypothetical protein
VVRQGHLIAVVGTFLIGCVVLLGVGCAGTSSESSKKEQGSSPKATSEEEARCQGTQTYHGPSFLTLHPKDPDIVYTTNDLPGCPNGGLLSGTDKPDQLGGNYGDDEIRGLGAEDYIYGGSGDDVIHGGPGDDSLLYGGKGEDVLYGDDGGDELIDGAGDDVIFCPDRDVVEGCDSLGDRLVRQPTYRGYGEDNRYYGEPDGADVIYGGDGNDFIEAFQDGQPDKLYCGKGKDEYYVEEPKNDHVSSSCEKQLWFKPID